VIPAVSDFLTSRALIMAGDVEARAVITRIEGRIEDWKAGRFPSPANPQSCSSSAMAWENAADLLRSAAFFDAAHYPDARFTSTAVVPVWANHYTVKGNLEVRGVTRPIELDADLVDRHLDPQTDTELNDFVVQGHLQRSAFGMTADSYFTSDRVDQRTSAHIQIVALGR
jgi:polyisoprenoid-binding protein YceI